MMIRKPEADEIFVLPTAVLYMNNVTLLIYSLHLENIPTLQNKLTTHWFSQITTQHFYYFRLASPSVRVTDELPTAVASG